MYNEPHTLNTELYIGNTSDLLGNERKFNSVTLKLKLVDEVNFIVCKGKSIVRIELFYSRNFEISLVYDEN